MTGTTSLKTAAAAAVVLLSPAATAATATASINSHGAIVDQDRGLISFPLVPHHEQRRRLGLPEHDDSESVDDRQNRRNLVTQINTDEEIMSQMYMGYGTHYVDLWCGSPPQRQTVIVDTGSTLTGFPGEECEDCGYPQYHINPYFENSESTTFQTWGCEGCSQRAKCNAKTDRCEMEQYYSEGSSWEAYEAIDNCYVGGFHNKALLKDNGGHEDIDPGHAPHYGFDTRISIQTKVTGLFKTQLADGIMGMCDAKQAYWHQMYRAHLIKEKQFSLCYVRPPHAFREGSPAGAMTLGGSDRRLHNTQMVYTTTVGTSSEKAKNEKTGYFDVHVRNMYLREGRGGFSVKTADVNAKLKKIEGAGAINDEGGVIVDSGTTDTYFSSLIQKSLRKHWQQFSGIKYTHNKNQMTPDEIAALPTILIQFAGDEAMNMQIAGDFGNGDPNQIPGLAGDLDKNYPYDVVVAIPPSSYMEALSDGSVMNRFYDEETDGTVLGANAMMGHDILFDAQNMRVGFAESNCDYAGILQSEGYPDVMEGGALESAAEEKKDEAEMTTQEKQKEKADEEHTEEEIEEDNENIEEYKAEGGHVAEFDDDGAHFTKTKYNKTLEIPLDNIIDNPGIAGIVLALVFLLTSICVYRCCCLPRRRRRRKRQLRKQREIELQNTSNGGGGFRDEVSEDGSESSYNDEYEDDEDAAEYGLSKNI